MFVFQLVAYTLLLALSPVLLSGAAATTGDYTNQWCVKPNDTSHCTCDPDHCKTLAEYTQDPGRYFTSNTTVIFLSGDHSLNTTLQIGNITNLAMVGNGSLIQTSDKNLPPVPSSRLNCTNSVAGFNIENIVNLVIQNLTFLRCGNVQSKCGSYHYKPLSLTNITALSLVNTSNLHASGLVLLNSSGIGFCGYNTLGNFTVEKSLFAFSSSGSNMELMYQECPSSEETLLHISQSHFLNGDSWVAASGLSIVMMCTNVPVTITSCNFVNNRAKEGGNIAIKFYNETDYFTNTLVIQSCYLANGKATEGGGLHITLVENLQPNDTQAHVHCTNRYLVWVTNTRFVSNYASQVGAGLYFSHLDTPGSFCLERKVAFANCRFKNNYRGKYIQETITEGVAVHLVLFQIPRYVQHGVPQLKFEFKRCIFLENVGVNDSAAVRILEEPSVSFHDCDFLNNNCTAITATNSDFVLAGNITVQGNTGCSGGGIALYESSMYMEPETDVLVADNRATLTGGAIHVENKNFLRKAVCFFQVATDSVLKRKVLRTINITLRHNSALVAGNAVYGGSIDNLSVNRYPMYILSKYVFDTIFAFNHSQAFDDTSFISSDPVCVCFCTNGTRDCDRKSINVSVYPGQTLHVPAVVVGQRNGTVPGSVVAVGLNMTLADAEQVQYIPTINCSSINYTILSTKSYATISLGIHRVGTEHDAPVVDLRIMDCPLGSKLSQQRCLCDQSLLSRGMSCDIASDTRAVIHRKPPYWVGACPQDKSTQRHLPQHPLRCPSELCLSEGIDIQTWSDTIDQDAQCMFGRTGILCGACKPGLSLTLGSTRCQHCSNYYISVLSAFVVGGLLLVAVLTALNLTVTEGTINGLIFYANIVHTNVDIFFPQLPDNPSLKVLASIPRVLIAWLNLDIGIEVCFYNGLDAYIKTWLQFAFPIYIWVIAGVIILLSRRYAIVARATGRHRVQVVATLFLLTFAKLLNTIITSLSPHTLNCDPKLTVWGSDGNIWYMQGKHIPLFVAAVLAMVCLSVPYTFILVSIQCLQRFNIRLVSRLKPVIDAYTGPYKDKCRFWTGYLLLVRIILFIATAINQFSPKKNLSFILVTCLHLLLLSVWGFGGVYRKRSHDMLESSFVLNLAVLSAVVILYSKYINHDSNSRYYSDYTSYSYINFKCTFCVCWNNCLPCVQADSRFAYMSNSGHSSEVLSSE